MPGQVPPFAESALVPEPKLGRSIDFGERPLPRLGRTKRTGSIRPTPVIRPHAARNAMPDVEAVHTAFLCYSYRVKNYPQESRPTKKFENDDNQEGHFVIVIQYSL